MRTQTNNQLTRLAKSLDEAKAMESGHLRLLALARELRMEAEIDHQLRSVSEWQNAIDSTIESAIEAGFGPDDFEAAGIDEAGL